MRDDRGAVKVIRRGQTLPPVRCGRIRLLAGRPSRRPGKKLVGKDMSLNVYSCRLLPPGALTPAKSRSANVPQRRANVLTDTMSARGSTWGRSVR
jgi:hypothetical protein